MSKYTPEWLRREAGTMGGRGLINEAERLWDHAAALEELARLKAPVDVAGIVAELRENSNTRKAMGNHYLAEAFNRYANMIESLAAQNTQIKVQLDKYRLDLGVWNDKAWHNTLVRAERAYADSMAKELDDWIQFGEQNTILVTGLARELAAMLGKVGT
jgi:hypothetical protein